jgi:hypothetical protein
MKWISVKEEKPPLNKFILVTFDSEEFGEYIPSVIVAKTHDYKYFGGDCCGDRSLHGRTVTHWMNLPKRAGR